MCGVVVFQAGRPGFKALFSPTSILRLKIIEGKGCLRNNANKQLAFAFLDKDLTTFASCSLDPYQLGNSLLGEFAHARAGEERDMYSLGYFLKAGYLGQFLRNFQVCETDRQANHYSDLILRLVGRTDLWLESVDNLLNKGTCNCSITFCLGSV